MTLIIKYSVFDFKGHWKAIPFSGHLKETLMGHAEKAEYVSILGSPAESIVVELTLPRLGEHDAKWVIAEPLGKEYFHYGYRHHSKAQPVNVHVYGERTHIMYLSKTGMPVRYSLELVLKKTKSGREFILVNFTILKRRLASTHEFFVSYCSPDTEKRPEWVYTTRDMNGIGVSVRPFTLSSRSRLSSAISEQDREFYWLDNSED